MAGRTFWIEQYGARQRAFYQRAMDAKHAHQSKQQRQCLLLLADYETYLDILQEEPELEEAVKRIAGIQALVLRFAGRHPAICVAELDRVVKELQRAVKEVKT